MGGVTGPISTDWPVFFSCFVRWMTNRFDITLFQVQFVSIYHVSKEVEISSKFNFWYQKQKIGDFFLEFNSKLPKIAKINKLVKKLSPLKIGRVTPIPSLVQKIFFFSGGCTSHGRVHRPATAAPRHLPGGEPRTITTWLPHKTIGRWRHHFQSQRPRCVGFSSVAKRTTIMGKTRTRSLPSLTREVRNTLSGKISAKKSVKIFFSFAIYLFLVRFRGFEIVFFTRESFYLT